MGADYSWSHWIRWVTATVAATAAEAGGTAVFTFKVSGWFVVHPFGFFMSPHVCLLAVVRGFTGFTVLIIDIGWISRKMVWPRRLECLLYFIMMFNSDFCALFSRVTSIWKGGGEYCSQNIGREGRGGERGMQLTKERSTLGQCRVKEWSALTRKCGR